jgi:hypothetical protein
LQIPIPQFSLHGIGEDVAGEPALGVAHDSPTHQLERHNRNPLLQDQSLELSERASVAETDEPGARSSSHVGRERQHERPTAAGLLRGLERRRRSRRVAARHLGPDRVERGRRNRAPEIRARGDLAAAVQHHDAAADRRRQRARELVEATFIEHELL